MNIILTNPPYDKKQIHKRILNNLRTTKPDAQLVYIGPFQVYSMIKRKEPLPDCCQIFNIWKEFGDDACSCAVCAVAGYNVAHDHCILTNILKKYVKYMTESCADHKVAHSNIAIRKATFLSHLNIYYTRRQPFSDSNFMDVPDEYIESWKKLYDCLWIRVLLQLANSGLYNHINTWIWFTPGTTEQQAKDILHLTDDEIKALEAYK